MTALAHRPADSSPVERKQLPRTVADLDLSERGLPAPEAVIRHEYRFATAAAWWDAIGRVPLDRVIFDPLPGRAEVGDVTRLDDDHDMLCELSFGTLIRKAMGYHESWLAARIITLLNVVVMERNLGVVAGADGMMRLLGRQVRIPDVSFVSRADLPGGKFPMQPVPDLHPTLAVEVISVSNSEREMELKLREYFEAGTRLVWYVYPQSKTILAYTAVDQVTTLSETDTLTAGDVLPGFEVKVADIFDVS